MLKQRKNKFRTSLKDKHSVIGRTKVLYKEDVGVLIGKIFTIKGVISMVLAIKFNDSGVDFFYVPLKLYRYSYTRNNYTGRIGVVKDKDFIYRDDLIKKIKYSMKLWKDRKDKRSYSKYNIHFNMRRGYNDISEQFTNVDITNDQLDEMFYTSSMVCDLSTMRAVGKYVKYDNYIIINKTSKDVLIKNVDYNILLIRN